MWFGNRTENTPCRDYQRGLWKGREGGKYARVTTYEDLYPCPKNTRRTMVLVAGAGCIVANTTDHNRPRHRKQSVT